MAERRITHGPYGHMLTNAAVWSADGRWIVYDTRSAPDGSVFDGTRIERVDVDSGRVELLYESRSGACCGVVTASPVDDRVVFILGPERPDERWRYGAARRQGVVVRASRPGVAEALDARDLVPPFTPGALRGGSHVHLFSGDGRLVSFTYEDAFFERLGDTAGPADARDPAPGHEKNLRAVGVTLCGRAVAVPATHPRNHGGSGVTVLVTRLEDAARPGGDSITRAFEEAWVGDAGYRRPDGSLQRYALAFQGNVTTPAGSTIAEVFVVDLPDDPAALTEPGEAPLAGTETTRPAPPRGVRQRRLTRTADRRYPGIQGPRHWLRSSPDGSRIACLMRDERGVVQIFSVSPSGGEPTQMPHDPWPVASSFTWSPDGTRIAYVADGSVMTVTVADGTSRRHTAATVGDGAPRPEACVFSPDGARIAFMRCVPHNQVFVVDV